MGDVHSAVWNVAKHLDERNNVEVAKLEETKGRYELELCKLEALKVRSKVEIFKALLLHERSQSTYGGDVGEIGSSVAEICEQVNELYQRWS